jgi:hypothetical protein
LNRIVASAAIHCIGEVEPYGVMIKTRPYPTQNTRLCLTEDAEELPGPSSRERSRHGQDEGAGE